GSMPTIGTANVTLTLAAMCFLSGRDILKSLH
ncbi:GMC family oxidoreductase, partial [Rhizobium ruizarguesonis]